MNSHRLRFYLCAAFSIAVLVAAMLWAKARDPFERIDFTVGKGPGRVQGITVLPKPVARHPTVIYLYGSGGNLVGSGRELRQLAELGLAAVGIEYNQTNQAAFDEQFRAVNAYVARQPWALEGTTAWMGFSLGAQRTLAFSVKHPELQPKLLVRLAGGWVNELESKSVFGEPTSGGRASSRAQTSAGTVGNQGLRGRSPSLSDNFQTDSDTPSPGFGAARVQSPTPLSTINSQPSTSVLLVHGEQDEIFPVADCRRVADVLRAGGTTVDLRILPGLSHGFGAEWSTVLRMAGECCVANLPRVDYAGALSGCALSPIEASRFNEAMNRAGRHRRELWKAVTASREPERHTVVNMIGRLEDYDLAHITRKQLRAVAQNAWRMRRAHAWCRDTPLEVFETFTANPRVFEEPLDSGPGWFSGRLRRCLKYSHTGRQAVDAVWRWMRERTATGPTRDVPEGSAEEVFQARGTTDCTKLAMLYTAVARSAGLAIRPVFMVERTGNHAWTEVWIPEAKQWRAYDGGPVRHANEAGMGNPLSVILAPTGERGVWNAESEGRWEAYTNNIGMFFPSGKVVVRVLGQGRPAIGELVGVLTGRYTPVMVERAWTDGNGEARFTLGMSRVLPYRFNLPQVPEGDWQWLQVKSNAVHEIVLHRENRKPYDSAVEPPLLVFDQQTTDGHR